MITSVSHEEDIGIGEEMAKRVLYTRTDGKWAWRLKADNGEIIAVDGSQGYENESDAREIADKIIAGHFAGAEKRISRPKTQQ